MKELLKLDSICEIYAQLKKGLTHSVDTVQANLFIVDPCSLLRLCIRGWSCFGLAFSLNCGQCCVFLWVSVLPLTYRRWSGDDVLLVLAVIRCPELVDPDHGLIRCDGGTLYGSRCELHCRAGFTVAGQPSIECLDDGRWSHDPSLCAGLSAATS